MAKASGRGARRSYKKNEESQAEKAANAIQAEMLEFWKAMASSSLGKWEKPWMSWNEWGVNGASGYEYKGNFNQWIINYATRDRESDYAKIVLTSAQITEMFFGKQENVPQKEKKKFYDTPAYEKGMKTLTSLFRPPASFSIWEKPDGSQWKSAQRKRPTTEEIMSMKLKEKKIMSNKFSSFAVFSAEDVIDKLPEKARAKIDELVAKRKPKSSYDFYAGDDIEKFIDERINEVIKRQGISVKEHGNEAFYVPSQDVIQKPKKEQFVNPVARYAVTMHELAHSTKHLAGRNPSSRNDLEYAIEEIVAESTAVFLVKELERDLEHALSSRPDIKTMFSDYYDNAMVYSKGWGSKFDFMEQINRVEDHLGENDKVVRTLLTSVAKSIDTLKNGEFTPEQRLEAKVKNFERMNPSKQKQQPVPEPEESPGMGM